jgi:tetratricopeptide (TPR) repeat protein
LWRLVERPTDQAQKQWERAEGLARDADPSRSLVMGWVMTRSDATSRAIPWLKSALQRLEKPEERERAAFNLFDAYLDVGDWRSAEEMWPAARTSLTPKELPDWLGRIAVAAARAGEQAEALRLWKQRTNLDRVATIHLDEMLRAGLREPLLAFYRKLGEQDPDCQSIEPMLEQLRRFQELKTPVP